MLILPSHIYTHTPGEAVFERQNVHEGATATQWRRNGRVVRAGETPARVVAVKGKGKRGSQQQQSRGAAAAAATTGVGGEKGEESSSLPGDGGAEEASVASGSTQGTGEQQQRSVELYGFWQVGGLRVSFDGRERLFCPAKTAWTPFRCVHACLRVAPRPTHIRTHTHTRTDGEIPAAGAAGGGPAAHQRAREHRGAGREPRLPAGGCVGGRREGKGREGGGMDSYEITKLTCHVTLGRSCICLCRHGAPAGAGPVAGGQAARRPVRARAHRWVVDPQSCRALCLWHHACGSAERDINKKKLGPQQKCMQASR